MKEKERVSEYYGQRLKRNVFTMYTLYDFYENLLLRKITLYFLALKLYYQP